ncbi:MAG: hypothetical protein ISR58_18170, partial [Anaerolineales bacterium]|nr:hypothetical protein [Anaerolineales bacterium]
MTQFDIFNTDSSHTDISNYSNLDQLLDVIYGMSDDPLAAAGTNVVISRGNPRAKILIIGEA